MDGTTAPAGIAATLADAIDSCADEIGATTWTPGTGSWLRESSRWSTRAADRAAMLVMDAHAHGLFSSSPEVSERIEWRRSQIKPSTRLTNERMREAVLVCRELWQLLINPARDPATRVTFASEAEMYRQLAAIVRGTPRKSKSKATTAASTIPPERRSPATTLKKAAKLLGRPNEDSGVRWLQSCIDDGTISAEKKSRQSFVFDKSQFPEGSWPSSNSR